MARYWLYSDHQYDHLEKASERLLQFAKDNGFDVEDVTLKNVAAQLDGNEKNGDPDDWVTFFCFWCHPAALWDLMLNAFTVADTDDHYQKIATWLAEHILAHYGSAIRSFEKLARTNGDFARMLTGVWRHRMCDDVWARLRAIQSQVDDPLPTMIPLEIGVEYMADSLSKFDRKAADKGRYMKDVDGTWKTSAELRRQVELSD